MASRGRPRTFDRDEALSRAMDVFWTKGFEGTSMTDLVAAMGIVSPSIYAAFGSKEALFREAVDRYATVDGAGIWAAASAAGTAYAVVEEFLMATASAFSRTDRPKGCMVTLSGLHASESTAGWREELAAKRAQNVLDLAHQLARGVERGEIAPTADVEGIARFYVTVQQGMSIQARDGLSREALEAIARSALAAWEPLVGERDRARLPVDG